MVEVPSYRLNHIKESISHIRALLAGKSMEQLASDSVARAALERFLERISEASRHIPASIKEHLGGDIPWKDIANLGNVLRHGYDRVDVAVLWSICANDLGPLETAIDAMLAAPGQAPNK
jgi:uncharacterized protein with HEPN domain